MSFEREEGGVKPKDVSLADAAATAGTCSTLAHNEARSLTDLGDGGAAVVELAGILSRDGVATPSHENLSSSDRRSCLPIATHCVHGPSGRGYPDTSDCSTGPA